MPSRLADPATLLESSVSPMGWPATERYAIGVSPWGPALIQDLLNTGPVGKSRDLDVPDRPGSALRNRSRDISGIWHNAHVCGSAMNLCVYRAPKRLAGSASSWALATNRANRPIG
jgi:hypothetical protein